MQAWDKFLAVQESALGKDIVDNWLRPLKVVRFDACNLYLEAADTFQLMWFEEHIRPKLKHSLFNFNQTPIKVHISLASQKNLPVKRKGQRSPDSVDTSEAPFQITFDYPDKLCTLERFVVTDGNQLAHTLLSELCAAASEPFQEKRAVQLGTYNPIYLYGDSGSGKTHLMCAVAHSLLQAGLRVIYARAETFTDHVISAIRAGEMHLFRQAYRNTDVLLLDDVQVFARKAATQEELFHTFNTLHMAGKQIILSSNRPPQELQHIEPRLISRFEWGIVLEIAALKEREDIRSLLQSKCSAFEFPLNPRTADYLIETFPSGSKSVIKALEALMLRSHISPSTSQASSTSIGVNQARLYLSDLSKAEQSAMLTPEKIIKHCAEHFGIRVEDVLGKSQCRECTLPRQLAAYLCRELLKMPYKKIGDLFDRDHSTIMSSVKHIKKTLESPTNDIAAPLRAIQLAVKSQHHPEEFPSLLEVCRT